MRHRPAPRIRVLALGLLGLVLWTLGGVPAAVAGTPGLPSLRSTQSAPQPAVRACEHGPVVDLAAAPDRWEPGATPDPPTVPEAGRPVPVGPAGSGSVHVHRAAAPVDGRAPPQDGIG